MTVLFVTKVSNFLLDLIAEELTSAGKDSVDGTSRVAAAEIFRFSSGCSVLVATASLSTIAFLTSIELIFWLVSAASLFLACALLLRPTRGSPAAHAAQLETLRAQRTMCFMSINKNFFKP